VSDATRATAANWVALARAFDGCLAGWSQHLDATWVEPWLASAGACGSNPSSSRAHWLAFGRWCGPPPSIGDLDSLAGHWCLMRREHRLARLCALALARRPGVLRSCVRRDARQALHAFLGPCGEALAADATRGACVPAALAERPPIEWAWVGYADMSRAMRWPTRSLRRWVRLGLPRQWPRALQPLLAAADPFELGEKMTEVERWFEPIEDLVARTEEVT